MKNTLHKIKSSLHRFRLFFLVLLAALTISTQLNDFEIAKNLEIFTNIYKELNTNYVDELDPEYLMEVGAEAMLKSLDPYSEYIPSRKLDQFRSSITGKYFGIGVSVSMAKDELVIDKVYENGPSDLAGLKPSDRILEIDGINIKGQSLNQISNQIRGGENTVLKLTIKRIGEPENLPIKLSRGKIVVDNTPYSAILDEGIAYVALTTFSEDAGSHLRSCLDALADQAPIQAIILDLRGNTGGLLKEAINVASVFLEEGTNVVQIKGRDKKNHQYFKSSGVPFDSEVKLSILIDERSASASEIVAGAVQDMDRGVIIGEKSFGKGLVQNTKNLSFGGKVKLTTARYFIPSGRCIQSLKYKDGQAVQLSDSLKTTFYTANNRKVLDGGGIIPDIKITDQPHQALVQELKKEHYFLDFVAESAQKKDYKYPNELKLSEEDFVQFKDYLSRNDYEYQTQSENLLKKLEQSLDKEGYVLSTQDQLEALKSTMKRSSNEAFQQSKKVIQLELLKTFALYYFNSNGMYAASIPHDPVVKAAREILKDDHEYRAILQKN